MKPPSTTEERFVTLETKVAYQEKLLADLSDILAEQSRDIADLRRQLERMERAYRDAKDEKQTLPHEPPPHY